MPISDSTAAHLMTSSCPSSFDLVLFASEKAYILMWANPRLERFEIVAIILENIDSKKREKGKEGKTKQLFTTQQNQWSKYNNVWAITYSLLKKMNLKNLTAAGIAAC